LENLAPEQRVLLWSMQVNPEAESGKLENLIEKVDWSAVQLLAIFHRVFPLLYYRLKGLSVSLLPAGDRDRLKMLYMSSVGQNLRLNQQLFAILDLLNKKETIIIPYKGPVLAERAYANPSLRYYTDLDFFTRSRDFPRVCRELTGAGYRPMMQMTEKMLGHWSRFGREFTFNLNRTWIDVHLRITEGPNFLSVEDTVWDNRTKIMIDSQEIPALSLEDELLVLFIHGTKHGWQFLGLVADIAHLVSTHPVLNWDKLICQAERTGCLTMMGTGLGLAQLICGLVLPIEVKERALISPRIEARATRFFNQIFSAAASLSRFQQRLIQITAFDSFAKNLRCLGYYMFTPKFKDLKTFSLPQSLSAGYYFLRPVRLFFDFWAALLKSIFKREGYERKIF